MTQIFKQEYLIASDGWRKAGKKTDYEFYPNGKDLPEEIVGLLDFIKDVIAKRTDGCKIEVSTAKNFPQHEGKDLPFEVRITMWDIAA